MDRLGDTFRWKSENVSTAEVSEVLGNYPGIIEANVYGVEVPGHDGRAGCAAIYIDPTQLGTFDFNGLLQYSREKLPKYAVPVFIRVLNNLTAMHNNKQNKVPLRNDGIDLLKLQERANKEAAASGSDAASIKYDTMYWCPSSLGNTKGVEDIGGYVVYTEADWNALKSSVPGAAKL
jgi:acyl-CoA synthetase (AMP-forming)/AMP-acid ligase II